MLTAVNDGKLTIEQLIEKMYTNPKRIFNLPDQGSDTFIEVDMERKWIIDDEIIIIKIWLDTIYWYANARCCSSCCTSW